MRSVIENQGYQEAPMSTLLLNGEAPSHTYAKTLDTFFSRHHLRVFDQPYTFEGEAVWTLSSTQDTGIGIATNTKSFIHLINENIDEERDKVVHDLVLTGCVDAVQYLQRPWVPLDARNATGDALVTDGRIAAIRLNACLDPDRAREAVPSAPATREKPSAVKRSLRNLFLTLKNDAFRGNIVYQAYWALRLGFGALFGEDDPEAERTLTIGGERFVIVPGPEAHEHPLAPTDPVHLRPSFEPVHQPRQRDYATKLELSFNGGWMGFGNDRFSTQELTLFVPVDGIGEVPAVLTAPTSLGSGWSLAPKVTLNTNRHVSHEFGYTFNSSDIAIRLENPLLEAQQITGPANIRQFSYNVLVHARPKGARIRPYGAIGPALQIIRVSEQVTNSRGVFRFAFKQVGVIAGAWNFGSRPPFEGGGVFQPALQYGGGVGFYLTEHFVVRADFRETLSKQPDFWTKSYPDLRDIEFDGGGRVEPGPLTSHGLLRHRLVSLGFGIAF